MNETWLAHHGIKGQKWGIRRFENPDGSLTEAGKKRYEKTEEDEKPKQKSSSLTIATDPVALVYDLFNKHKDKPLTKLPIIKGKLYVSSVLFMPFNAIARKNEKLAKGLGIATVATLGGVIGAQMYKDKKASKEFRKRFQETKAFYNGS